MSAGDYSPTEVSARSTTFTGSHSKGKSTLPQKRQAEKRELLGGGAGMLLRSWRRRRMGPHLPEPGTQIEETSRGQKVHSEGEKKQTGVHVKGARG